MKPRPGLQPQAPDPVLLDLKAIVLGIDWEITEKDLEKLRNEVIRLEEVFADSRPKLIFLQGLGSLAAYIRLKKGNAHQDAFKLLHSFFAGLERIVTVPMSLEEEKAVLFPEVEKFNAFKAVIASTITPEAKPAAVEIDEEDEDDEGYKSDGGFAPALSDLPEGEARGFREEDEAAALGISPSEAMTSQIDKFFLDGQEGEQLQAVAARIPEIEKDAGEVFRDATEAHLDSLFRLDADADQHGSAVPHVDQEIALQGVDVETEADDESEESGLPFAAGQPAPALADLDEEISAGWKMPEDLADQQELAGDVAQRFAAPPDEDIAGERGEPVSSPALADEENDLPGQTPVASLAEQFAGLEEAEALQGVDVETDEDDYAGGDLAPALADVPMTGPGWQAQDMDNETEDQLIISEPAPALYGQVREERESVGWMRGQDEAVTDLEEHLDSFFDFEEEKEPPAPATRQTLAFTDEISAGGPFEESIGESVEAEVEEMAGLPEEYAALPEVAAPSEEPPAGSAAVSPLLAIQGLEDESAPGAAAAQAIAEGEEAENEIVFDLADDNEELFTGPYADEILVQQATPEQELLAAADQDLPDIFEQALESIEEVTDQADHATATVPEPGTTPREDGDFLAVFEEADEIAEEEVWPDRSAAEETQPELEQARSADLEEIAASTPVEEEMPGGQSLSVAEEEPSPVQEDPLENLRTCVSSVGIELEDSIFQGLYAEINELRSRWATHPLEKSFLQLVSTITQHIDRYRYEASSEAFSLFQSVVKAFGEALEWHHPAAAQEMLLQEMTKVLLWQQGMLNRQAVSKGDGWAFADPLRFQAGESPAEEEISFAGEDAENEISADPAGIGGKEKAVDEALTAMGEEFPMEKDTWFSATGPASPGFEQVPADEIGTGEGLADAEAAGSENLALPEEKRPAEQGPLADHDADDLQADIRVSSDSLSSEYEAAFAGERNASADGNTTAADSPLTGQIIALIQREFGLIRRELHSQFEALRRELKGRED